MTNTTSPSKSEIEKAKTNLANLQHLNDYIYNHSTALAGNAFLLLEEPDRDLGLNIGLDLFSALLGGFGSVFGPPGTFLSNLLNGIFKDWATTPPPSLNSTFAKLLLRLSAMNTALDLQLAEYSQNIERDWNKTFTFNDQKVTLSGLAKINVPTELDPIFFKIYKEAYNNLDKSIWTSILKSNYVVTKMIQNPAYGQYQGTPFTLPGDKNAFPYKKADEYLTVNHSYFLVSKGYINQPGCAGAKGWWMQEYHLGRTVGTYRGGLSKDACRYLFKNNYTETNYHAKGEFQGLFDRKFVFTELGIRQSSANINFLTQQAPAISNDYKKATESGNTLHALIYSEGRKSVEDRVIKKAHEDPIFARKLTLEPYKTLEEYLGVKIPETSFFNIVVEGADLYGLVIPLKEIPEPPTPYNPTKK